MELIIILMALGFYALAGLGIFVIWLRDPRRKGVKERELYPDCDYRLDDE